MQVNGKRCECERLPSCEYTLSLCNTLHSHDSVSDSVSLTDTHRVTDSVTHSLTVTVPVVLSSS